MALNATELSKGEALHIPTQLLNTGSNEVAMQCTPSEHNDLSSSADHDHTHHRSLMDIFIYIFLYIKY